MLHEPKGKGRLSLIGPVEQLDNDINPVREKANEDIKDSLT